MLPLDYLSFDLLLEAMADGYRARVVASPVGEAKQDFDLAALAMTTDTQSLGAALFATICTGEVGDCLSRAWQQAQADGKGLRLRLHIDAQAPALAALPWETLTTTSAKRLAAWATPTLFSHAADDRALIIQMADDTQTVIQPTRDIDTSGGAFIGGSATVGGDLAGRDKIIHGDEVHGDKIAGDKITHIYMTAAERPAVPDLALLAAAIERQPFEPETVLIPAGAFVMGDDEISGDAPRRVVELPAYRIGKTAVTNRQYAEFLKRNPAQPEPDRQHWFLRKPKKAFLDHPVVNITWRDAQAYCAWLSQATGRQYALPSEAQWEKAARGPTGRIFPWGDGWREGYANVAGDANRRGTTPVETFEMAASPYGCLDLLGNVQEWTNTPWGEDDPPTAYGVRGGSFRSQPHTLRCSSRDSIHPDAKVAWRGFRVLLVVK